LCESIKIDKIHQADLLFCGTFFLIHLVIQVFSDSFYVSVIS